AAIAAGVAKFNVGTRLKKAFLEAVLANAATWSGTESVHDLVGSHKASDFLEAGKAAVTESVRQLIRLYGGTHQAPRIRAEEGE
ncbi:MAG: class II fructose-bisphosphate aldolase, partial [Actinomycetota bacterium]